MSISAKKTNKNPLFDLLKLQLAQNLADQRQQWDLEFEFLHLVLLLSPSNQKPLMREGCAGTRSVTPQERSDEESEGDSRSPKQPDPSAIMRTLSPQTGNQTGGILLKLGWPRERVPAHSAGCAGACSLGQALDADDQFDAYYDYDVDGQRRLKTIGSDETVYADPLFEITWIPGREMGTVNVYLGSTRLVSKVVPLDSPSTGYELQNTYYYHADHIGNSTLITDYQGQEFERLAFTPHGELWQDDSQDALGKIDYLFTGKQVDAETGWYNFGARYLNPTTGLWISADPALGEYIPNAPLTDEDKQHNQNLPGMGGLYNPINFALYHFAGNNPVRYVDPDGRMDWGDIANALGAVADAVDSANMWLDNAGLDLNALDGAGREIEVGVDGLRLLAKLARGAKEAEAATAEMKVALKVREELHHAIPKFIGGAADQALVKLEKGLHTKFHQELRSAMADAGLSLKATKNGGIGISKAQIAQYFRANPGSQDKALDVLMNTTQKFDKENGTNLYSAIVDAIKDGKMNWVDSQ